jgi:hypothetical protein
MYTDLHGCFPFAFSIRKGIYPAWLLILKQFWQLAAPATNQQINTSTNQLLNPFSGLLFLFLGCRKEDVI